jgi:hypothetical protein
MPVPNDWEAPKSKEYPPLPEDVYQVFIKDVELTKGKAYQSNDEIWQLNFTFQVLEEGEFYGRRLWKRITPVISAAKANKKPANFNLVYEAVYKKTPYENQLAAINASVINDFIGKQLRLAVREAVSEEGKPVNRIDSYLATKKELPLPKKELEDNEEKEEPAQEGEDYDINERIKEESDIPMEKSPF